MKIAHDSAEAQRLIADLKAINDQLDTNATNSQKQLESNLSGWKGQASSSMGESNTATYSNINDCSETWKGMAEYIKKDDEIFNEMEDYCASFKI